MVVATDTDVLVLAIAMSVKLLGIELWLAFGHGKNFHYIPAHEIAYNLGSSNSNAILFFHALTGCDTISYLWCWQEQLLLSGKPIHTFHMFSLNWETN